jgi:site-specific DNA-methyltransferase (cytosine-N4-specific)
MPVAYETDLGRCHHADALEVLRDLPENSIDLVLTSPPYALRRKKRYGNADATAYMEWFLPFAEQIHRVLKPTGSFVFEIAPPWERGTGTRSLFLYQLILELCKTFHLCQELYWYNPARLPTPAEYVTVRRTRVKDAVHVIWWLGKTASPRADNRRVLRPYSNSMARLFREGVRPAVRPSRHRITTSFERNHGGAIPPNLLEIPNTTSNDPYLWACKEAGLEPHPARFPEALPDFVVRLLTEPGDCVLDPFAGSNVTGWVAERLQRRWLACEQDATYVAGSGLRFGSSAVWAEGAGTPAEKVKEGKKVSLPH